METLNEWGPVTVLLCVLVVVAAVAGAVVTIVDPATLSFAAYLDRLQTFAVGLGVLGVGRGVVVGAKAHGEAVGRGIMLQSVASRQAPPPVFPAAPSDGGS